MSTANVTNGEPVTFKATEKIDVLEAASALYIKGVQRFAELQKRSIDVTADQNAELIDTWKKLTNLVPGAPGTFMLDLVSSAVERYADTQKGAIDLWVEQGNAAAGLIQDRAASAAKVAEGAVSTVKKSVEYAVAAQRKALDSSAAHAKAAVGNAKQHMGMIAVPDEAAVDSLHRGIDSFVETQKEFLDIAAMPFAGVK